MNYCIYEYLQKEKQDTSYIVILRVGYKVWWTDSPFKLIDLESLGVVKDAANSPAGHLIS